MIEKTAGQSPAPQQPAPHDPAQHDPAPHDPAPHDPAPHDPAQHGDGSAPPRTRRERRPRRRWAGLVAVSAAVGCLAWAGAAGPPVLARTSDAVLRGQAVPAYGTTPRAPDALQVSLDELVGEHGFPGALASVREPNGRTRDYTAGVADLATGQRMPVDGRVRLASNTKMFTATVMLQLVGEGRVDLDAPVERYLPAVVRGDGFDGRTITVRQLLQHTSGLPDYDQALFKDFLGALHTYVEPYEVVAVALSQPAEAAPGVFSYSNTNYILAGLIVQKVTGRPVGEEIRKRIIDPAGLRDTYWPGVGEQGIRGPHPRGYFPATGGGEPVDITGSDPSAGWAAGALIGTPSDLNRFLAALLGGDLLAPEQLAQMKTTVDAPGFDTVGGSRYGLGLATFALSCGGFAWTHGGIAPGYVTGAGITAGGRAATVAVTSMIATEAAAETLDAALDTALCG